MKFRSGVDGDVLVEAAQYTLVFDEEHGLTVIFPKMGDEDMVPWWMAVLPILGKWIQEGDADLRDLIIRKVPRFADSDSDQRP